MMILCFMSSDLILMMSNVFFWVSNELVGGVVVTSLVVSLVVVSMEVWMAWVISMVGFSFINVLTIFSCSIVMLSLGNNNEKLYS